jgi:hypothetical protein
MINADEENPRLAVPAHQSFDGSREALRQQRNVLHNMLNRIVGEVELIAANLKQENRASAEIWPPSDRVQS